MKQNKRKKEERKAARLAAKEERKAARKAAKLAAKEAAQEIGITQINTSPDLQEFKTEEQSRFTFKHIYPKIYPERDKDSLIEEFVENWIEKINNNGR